MLLKRRQRDYAEVQTIDKSRWKNHRKLDDAICPDCSEDIAGCSRWKPQKSTNHAGEGEKRLIKLVGQDDGQEIDPDWREEGLRWTARLGQRQMEILGTDMVCSRVGEEQGARE